MNANQREHLALDTSEQRTVALGAAIKVAACVVVCALVTIIGLSAIDPGTAVVGTLPPSAATTPTAHVAASVRVFEERRARFVAARDERRTLSAARNANGATR